VHHAVEGIMTYYKWLNQDRTTTYQSVKWPKRVGFWTPDAKPKLCNSGWHLATHQGIAEHARTGAVLWIAEGRGAQDAQDDKIAFTSARLVSQVGTLTQVIAVQWAAECAKRVLKLYEDRYPEDKRPREAIQAALKWVKDPTEANRAAANAAAYAAYVANAAAYAATYAAYVANAAAYAATYAANAANAAAYDAAYAAANAAAYAANAANAAAYAAAYAAYDAAAYAAACEKEREWQSDRLLELLRAS
jgi:hypothetical protein